MLHIFYNVPLKKLSGGCSIQDCTFKLSLINCSNLSTSEKANYLKTNIACFPPMRVLQLFVQLEMKKFIPTANILPPYRHNCRSKTQRPQDVIGWHLKVQTLYKSSFSTLMFYQCAFSSDRPQFSPQRPPHEVMNEWVPP